MLAKHGPIPSRKDINTMLKLLVRRAKFESHRVFNLRCWNENYIPNSLAVKTDPEDGGRRYLDIRRGRALLRDRMLENESKRAQLRDEYNGIRDRVMDILPSSLYKELNQILALKWEHVYQTCKERQKRRFNCLVRNAPRELREIQQIWLETRHYLRD